MPELPEVETMVRGIRDALIGGELQSFRRTPCTRKPISIVPNAQQCAKLARGQRVVAVRRFAKRVLIEMSSGGIFAIEPRMTGLMLLADPPTQEHLRAEWSFASDPERETTRLWFWDRRGLGTIAYFEPGEFTRQVETRVGRDALAMTPARWERVLSNRRRPIKVALLDQTLVAGIGNLYASEMLFLAGIAPTREAGGLTSEEISRLSAACKTVLRHAIRYEGSTLADGTYRNALAKTGQYQNAHRVYAKAGEACERCGGEIERLVQAQRSTFFCRGCQG